LCKVWPKAKCVGKEAVNGRFSFLVEAVGLANYRRYGRLRCRSDPEFEFQWLTVQTNVYVIEGSRYLLVRDLGR
jgi:hypothetical protein